MAHWFNSRKPIDIDIDFQRQSVAVEGNRDVRKSCLSTDCQPYYFENTRTLYDSFRKGSEFGKDNPALGWHRQLTDPYEFMSYGVALDRMRDVGCGMVACGLKPGQQTNVAIYAQNCVEWVLTQYGCYHFSMVVVPIYDTLGPKASTFIISQAEVELVVCDTEARVKNLLDAHNSGDTPTLATVVHIWPVSTETKEKANASKIKLISFQDMESNGQKQNYALQLPKPSDLAVICYTSGTTGEPKGAMLSHGNMVASASSIMTHLNEQMSGPGDVMISYLPLAHIFEHIAELIMFMTGAAIGFYSGNILTLIEDVQVLKPTVFLVVPRVLNRVYDAVMAKVNKSIVKRTLFDVALRAKKSNIQRRIFYKKTLWDRVVFKEIQQKLGGNVRFMFCSGAPLPENVMDFARCGLGCLIVEGFGQTESSGTISLSLGGDITAGHVGPPVPNSEVKLIDAPDMGYYASEQRGEICVRGPNVFVGYYKDPDKTAEVIDQDGWLKTGDIGMWQANGTLKLIDRKRNIIKLPQGEFVALEKVENIYLRSLFVAQIFVYGNGLERFMVAVVVPDEATVKSWARDSGSTVAGDSFNLAHYVGNPALKADILEDLQKLGKAAGLMSFEQVKDIHVTSLAFTIENELLTPTMKTKRHVCRERFARQIEAMYLNLRSKNTTKTKNGI